ncbi:MAG: putative LPS assembly protein LptD [Chitinophagaceae bacterium]
MAFNSTNNAKQLLRILSIVTLFVVGVQLTINAALNNQHFNILTVLLNQPTLPKKASTTETKKKPTQIKNKNAPPLSQIAKDSTKKLVETNILTIDTTPKKNIDTSKKIVTTIDTLPFSKDSLDAPVKYTAKDSGVFILNTQEFYLYGKAMVEQKSMSLEAGNIQYNGGQQTMIAFGSLDSTNDPEKMPTMKDGSGTTRSDTITFNLKTQKGRTVNSFYNEGEIFVNASVLKKIDSNSFYGFKCTFTTCNLDHPHFAIRAKRLKIISNKLAISGPASPEFEGVPLPIGLPFGIFPMNPRGRHGGLLPPQFTTSEDFGFGLEGLGWYKVINDNVDVTLRSNIYSYGGWMVNLAPKYIKRYHYSGSLNVTFQNTRILNRSVGAKEEFTSTQSFMINWSHSRDNRARPGTTFGANVNFGSTKFNSNVLNNPFINFQNRINSNINYSKDFRGKANLSLNASHSQNNTTKEVNIQFPTLNVNVVTFYPFQKKDKVGTPKWYENIGLGYSGNFTNQVGFYDTAFSFKKLLDTAQWGATHNVPITISLPALGPITFSPSITYQERWYGQKIFRRWNTSAKKIDTTIEKGFYTARDMSFGIAANTRIFGTVNFKKGSVQAIRHEIRPNISVNYKPNMAASYHETLQTDSAGTRYARVSQFDGVMPGSFGEGRVFGVGFGIDNVLEMKKRNNEDTTGKGIKVKLIDGFGFSGFYNAIADSFHFSPINLYLRTNLFEIFNITAGATLDPYVTNNNGRRIDKLQWTGSKFSLGTITNGNIAISTQIQSKPRDGKTQDQRLNQNQPDPFMTPEEQQRQLQFSRANPAEFTDFNIPWSLNLSYSFNFNRVQKADYSGFTTQSFSSLNFNGDFSLTEKWKMGATGFFDVNSKTLQQLSFFVTREMHCWQLSINVTPVNTFRSFNITLMPKSGILRDLRINRTRTFVNQ